MFVNNLDPELVSFGVLEIRWYGLIYVIGFLVAYYLLYQAAKNEKIEGLSQNEVELLLIYIMLGVVIGARLFEVVFFNPSYYLSNPSKIIAVWQGGLSFHGGLVGIAAGVWLFSRNRKVRFLDLADFLVIPATFFLALGRIGNFFNNELYGTVTDVSWCVKFQTAPECRHPYQLYSALKRMGFFLIFLFIYTKRKFERGFLLWLFVGLMGLGRFVVDFWRAEKTYFSLTMGQYLSIVMIGLSAYVILKRYWKELITLF